MRNFQAITVSQLNNYIKVLMDSDEHLEHILVVGEISNFKGANINGHIYFSLKDEESSVSAVMFRNSAKYLKFTPENGMKVYVFGRVSVYEKSGNYQIYADRIEPVGVGAMAQAYEELKNKLDKEGLFDLDKKRPLPKYPKKIGVITSATGAAFHDIINVISRRYPLCEIIFCPAFVQGSECAASNISALEEINKHDDIDLIILGRGGGSKEDLCGYNDENLVRAVRNSKIPVITGIGHEIDTSLCDLASDKSAPTPSAAAEIAVPDIAALYQMNDDLLVQINKEIKNYLENKEKELTSLNVIIKSFDPLTTVNSRITEIENLKVRAENAIKSYLSKEEIKVNSLDSELKRLDPVKMMKKGLLTVDISGKKLISAKELKVGDKIFLNLSDGTAGCTVDSIKLK